VAKKAVSIKDVAQRSGVSIATVSNVLNNRRYVSEQLRERVYEAVRELDYAASPIARSMRSSKTYTIGVIVLDFNCIFFAPLLKGIQNVMSKAGYSVVTYDSNYSGDLEKKYVRMMTNHMVDGLIFAGIANAHDREFYADLQRDAHNKEIPMVCIENDLSDLGIDSVFVNNFTAAHTATSHMIELGCKRIAHIKAPSSVDTANNRCHGYRSALEDAQLPFDPALEIAGNYSPISGYDAIQTLLQQDIQFDGVFAANDQMAVGAIRALHNAGMRVPEDVKVVGFDNTFIASIMEPSLTTINVPNYQMGVSAAHQLLSRIQNPSAAEKAVSLQMDYELIIRRSTMSSAQTSWDMVYW